MRTRVVAGVLAVSSLLACGASPPSHFASGGAGLDIVPGKWSRVAGDVVINANGVVTVGGKPGFTFDKQGRVRDDDGDPYAVVEQGGRLVGSDDKPLGILHGTSVQSPAGSVGVAIAPNGEITIKDALGHRPGGAWTGDCMSTPSAQSFCTLVAYLVTIDDLNRQARVHEAGLRRVNRIRK